MRYLIIFVALFSAGLAHAQIRTPISTDAFTGYTPDAFPSTNWENLDGFNGNIHINAGEQVTNSHTGTMSAMRRSAGTYSTEQYAECSLIGLAGTGSGDKGGVILRASADAVPNEDHYRIYFDDTNGAKTTRIERVINGASTSLATDVVTTWATTNRLSAHVTGVGATVTISVYKDDVVIGALSAITDTNAARIVTAGRPGLVRSEGANTFFLDDFEAGDVTPGSATGLLRRRRGR